MTKLKSLWVPVLLGVLLMATLVGVGNATPNARPREQGWMVVSVPTSSCTGQHPDTTPMAHSRNYVDCPGGFCVMVCPVQFPAAGEQAVGAVTVRRVTMYAYDNSGPLPHAAFALYKTYPPNGSALQMADAGTVDSTADPQTVIDFTIDSPVVYRVNSPSLEFGIVGTDIRVYGVFIHYTW